MEASQKEKRDGYGWIREYFVRIFTFVKLIHPYLLRMIIQSVDNTKQICQNWKDVKCEECDDFVDYELN